MRMNFEDIVYEKQDGIAKITINRPKVLNALRLLTYQELTKAIDDAAWDKEIGVVVLTGSGDRAFSSGGDVKAQATRTIDSGRHHLKQMQLLSIAIRNCGKPVIAAVDGYCVGGGHELHLWCDITIATDRSKFGQTGPRVGSVPVWGALQLLPRIVGEKKAREIVFLCKQYDAHEAERMGLVNKVVAPDKLWDEVNEWCQSILDKSPQAIRLAKLGMNFESDQLFPSVTLNSEWLAQMYGNEENMEGINAFNEKRPPDFRKFRK